MQLPGSIGAADVFDGVLGVMTEVAAKKISSEEESFSNLSLMIFHNNWLGGYAQILPFAEVCLQKKGNKKGGRKPFVSFNIVPKVLILFLSFRL